MKKVRFILVFSLFIYLVFTYTPFTSAAPDFGKEITDMTNLVKQEDLSINLWEVTVKEEVPVERFAEIKQFIQQQYPSATFKKEITDQANKFVLNPQIREGINERFLLIAPKMNSENLEVVYTASGTEWGPDVRTNFSNKMTILTREIFTENMTKFSCVQTKPSVIIDSVYLFNNLQQNLNVQALNKIEEDDFVVLSGYTSRWEAVIPIPDNPMNVQIAAREGLGGKTTITIGTPIIVSEY